MPELPEVETTRRALENPLQGKVLTHVIVRCNRLRCPVPTISLKKLRGQTLLRVERRAKYLLFQLESNTIIIHLGMSGTLRVLNNKSPIKKHDHVDFIFDDTLRIRFNDPRRFGAILTAKSNEQPPYLESLGVEPLTRACTGRYLFDQSRRRKSPIKSLLMNNKVIVGIGNIYATESLFYAKINPWQPANTIALEDYINLTKILKKVLRNAIRAGGTTLKDFYHTDGNPGYFKQYLAVYGKANQPCPCCKTLLKKIIIAGRTTVYCLQCQAIDQFKHTHSE